MKKQAWLWAMVILLGCGWAVGRAQQDPNSAASAPARVGVVNMTLVFDKLQIIQDLEKIFTQERDKVKAEAEARNNKIKELQTELESGAFAKESADYQQREAALEQLQMEGKLWLTREERRIRDAHKKWFEEVYKRVSKSCQDIAENNGVDLMIADNPIEFNVPDSNALVSQILQKKVVYASPRVDLTADVMSRVDADYLRDGGASIIKLAK
ncbi:MAG: hypothetical protein HJJLKODD_01435 [Phycisphaerae bacterium]|nr:hypothetical protein [Phycisphaerae bacterium]